LLARWVACEGGPAHTYRYKLGAARAQGEGIITEATGRAEVERRLIERSLQDDAFREQLLADPRGGRGARARDAPA
jgi:hypothetical protein